MFVIAEPNGAMTWFPCNDSPRDKATYSFQVTVPKPFTVAANGLLTATEDAGDRTTFIWDMRQPMATYLAAINVGRYELRDQGVAAVVAENATGSQDAAGGQGTAGDQGTAGGQGVAGVPIRNYVAPAWKTLRRSSSQPFPKS